MHIEIYPTHNQIPEGQLIGKNVVIIDVLRATSVIATALNNGANKVKTTSSVEDALKQKKKDNSLLLGGERYANKIEGFDFGNSPLEYTPDKVQNKTILLSTSNGTKAVKKASGAKILIAASFLNIASIVEYIEKLNENLSIICSGTNGRFSMDDGLCAGLILHELRKIKNVSTSDFGEILTLPFQTNNFSLKELLSSAFHLKVLQEKGHSVDIDFCLNISVLSIIPIWNTDDFVRLKP